jgi:type II secretory pathway pseudopilin PulG
MKLRQQHNSNQGRGSRVEERAPDGGSCRSRRCYGFTLAEVLAALAFLAILIPVVVECLTIASRAGEVAERKAQAARVAANVLNESIVTTNWAQSSQNGTVEDGTQQYKWTLESDPWNQDPMRVLTVDVKYSVQGKDYSVQLSTLVDGSTLNSTNN